ncbi:hypothetical protein [Ahrensia marina]|uniref:Chemotaxis protein n=1 Tax=Ahrensia marina TaxID=1514904 RepID=A0A0M9GKX3_9HYPH|nr:hypothetical protein [Ahrensia marina]KPB00133.1 hypothetical protein SU32_15605 [Ahrensia marina]
MRKLATIATMLLAVLAETTSARADISSLDPTQLVRSFQRAQDSIALGDKASIGMQRALYKMVRNDLTRPHADEVVNERNLRAVLSFAISGGGVALVYARRDAFKEFPDLQTVASAVQRYNGQNASEVFGTLEPRKIGGILGATIALVRAQHDEDRVRKTDDLNYVKLTLPGTIFEESALRAIMPVYREKTDQFQFIRAASRYARAFGTSPFAATFANEMVRAAVDLDDPIFRGEILKVLSFLPDLERQALLNRIKRAASLAGKRELFFALEKNELPDGQSGNAIMSDADRQLLHIYNQIDTITAQSAQDALTQVRNIIPSDLQEKNRRLRGVVLSLLTAIVAEPEIDDSARTASLNADDDIIEPMVEANVDVIDPALSEDMQKTEEKPKPDGDELKLDSFVEKMRTRIGGADELLETLE